MKMTDGTVKRNTLTQRVTRANREAAKKDIAR